MRRDVLPDALANMSPEIESALRQKLLRVIAQRRIDNLFPDLGVHRRELYTKHVAHFAAGLVHRERCFMAGNRVGKTVAGAYEVALHLTGEYPHWWTGRRFAKPVNVWCIGSTLETTRDIVQIELYGRPGEAGTGTIPGADIIEARTRSNTNGALDYLRVRHVSGGVSVCGFKSYDQGRRAFEGTAKDVIWLDEEPPETVYNECLTRTATTNGIIIMTFTPLSGATKVVTSYLKTAIKISGVGQ